MNGLRCFRGWGGGVGGLYPRRGGGVRELFLENHPFQNVSDSGGGLSGGTKQGKDERRQTMACRFGWGGGGKGRGGS